MNQNRKQQSDPNRVPILEQAERSREKMRGSSSSQESDSRDRGTSSDRAMFSDRNSSEPRGRGSSGERGRGRNGAHGSPSADGPAAREPRRPSKGALRRGRRSPPFQKER